MRPTVAIVGRPNVGKSTLFNRLVGRRRALVHPRPGMTRDRLVGTAEIGPEREVDLIDTGGLAPGDELGLDEQVLLAVEESDLLILVLDGKDGLTAADEAIWERLRPYDTPTIAVVNKGDARVARESFHEFHALGVDPILLVSAEHGGGVEDLRTAVAAALPETDAEPRPEAPSIAIVGRPNVGKSSLLNRLVGEPRVLVAPDAGTTRDPVDTLVEWDDRRFLLVDTAGIRRRSQRPGTPDALAVMMARRRIERADLALVVLDATESVTTGDLSVAGTAWELGRAVVVVCNKWDLLDDESRRRLERSWHRMAETVKGAPWLNVSALTGRGIDRLFPAVADILAAYRLEVATSELNRLLEEIVTRHRPPSDRGQPWKLYYATQVSTGPPTFMLFANRTLPRTHSYRRYLENALREHLGLGGVPVRLVIRERR